MQDFYPRSRPIPPPAAKPASTSRITRFLYGSRLSPWLFTIWIGIWVAVNTSWIVESPNQSLEYGVGAFLGVLFLLTLVAVSGLLAAKMPERAGAWLRRTGALEFAGLMGILALYALDQANRTMWLGAWVGGAATYGLVFFRRQRKEVLGSSSDSGVGADDR